MATALTADFFGGGTLAAPAVKKYVAPDDKPNPKNPGGVSNNQLKRQQQLKQGEIDAKKRAADLAATKARLARENEAKQKAASKGGSLLGDFVGLAKSVGSGIVNATAKPALQVINPVAAIAVHTTSKAVGGKGTIGGVAGKVVDLGAGVATQAAGVKLPPPAVVKAASTGKASAIANVAKSGLEAAGVKTPPLPSASKVGGEAMAGISLPKVKVSVPSASDLAKQAKAKATQTASAIAKQATTAAKQTVSAQVKAVTAPAAKAVSTVVAKAKATVAAAAPKVTPPKAPTVKVAAAAAPKPKAPAPAPFVSITGSATVKPVAVSASTASLLSALNKPKTLSAAEKAAADAATAKAKADGAKKLLAASPVAAATPKPAPMPTTTKGAAAPKAATTAAPTPAASSPKPTPVTVKGPAEDGIFIRLNGTIPKERRWAPAA